MGTTSYSSRIRWKWVNASGRLIGTEMAADFIVNQIVGGDGVSRPDPNDMQTRIAANFPTPSGATIVILGVSSSQTPAIYS